MIITLCHLGWRGVLSGVVASLCALVLWWFFILCSPSDVAQVPEVLSWRVVVFYPSAVVVQVYVPPLAVAQWGVKVFVSWPC